MTDRSSSDNRSRIVSGLIWAGFALAFLFPVAAYAYIGTFSRFISDDYCTAWTLREKGFLESQVYWYTKWSGRYTFTFLVNLLQSFGPLVTRIIPGLSLAAWVIGSMLFIRKASVIIGDQLRPFFALIAGCMVVFTVAVGVPSTFQSIYWLTGISTYTFPLVLVMFYATWVLSYAHPREARLKPGVALGLSGLIAFVLGGFSETYVSLQTALLLATLLVTASTRSAHPLKHFRCIALSGLVGSLLSIVVILAAPGTGIRSSLISDPEGLSTILRSSFQDLKIFLSLAWRNQLPLLMICGVVPGLLLVYTNAEQDQFNPRMPISPWVRILLLTFPPIAILLLMVVTIVPYEYAVGSYPDARVLITTQAVMVLGIVIWSLILGRLFSNFKVARTRLFKPLSLGLLVILLGGAIYYSAASVREVLTDRSVMQFFAESWDRRDAFLRDASRRGLEDVEAASLNHMGGLSEIGYDPYEWVNRCIAQYYELSTVVAK